MLTRRSALAWLGSTLGALPAGQAMAQDQATWERIATAARGQTVQLHSASGHAQANRYLQWVGTQMQERSSVRLEHSPLRDMAQAVQRVRSDKAIDRALGAADMLWLRDGPFADMKREGLLYGPLHNALRNHTLLDPIGKPCTAMDEAEPVDAMAVPWGLAQLTFMVDKSRVATPPQNVQDLLALARSQPGRMTYPRPSDTEGNAFLQQLLLDLAPEREALYRAATPASLERALPAVTAYLDQLHPLLWQGGRQLVANTTQIRQLVKEGTLLFNLSINPFEAALEIANQRLPESVISFQFAKGTWARAHFMAIPFNARSKAGALLLADFLLSPAAQARKADPAVWGDGTVLRLEALPPAQQALFQRKPLPGELQQSAPALAAPHPSWVLALENAWTKRYAL